ncbi:uncharacterized protein SCHCODRAFT_02345748 [Schizophyllum commune H4-8]|uniref:Expressed protein n=1 Tax=Schizophyllum commune (strain H4-8 / FGSC 9210) TaxID=578458 RepID=D8Q9C5_SCHCM|nr:uncharacterized protein SCHCODRAFT_02345748 [Schizophyllum commune H4-8]KAI5890466.1 hypothetical protein SCHCODRAFT_02345748 [Schizophyllum commune H4-8]
MRSRALYAKWFDRRQVDPGAAGARPRAVNLGGGWADGVRRWSSSARTSTCKAFSARQASSSTRRFPEARQATPPATTLRPCAAPPVPASSLAAAERVVRGIRRRVVHRDTVVRSMCAARSQRRCGVERWSSE